MMRRLIKWTVGMAGFALTLWLQSSPGKKVLRLILKEIFSIFRDAYNRTYHEEVEGNGAKHAESGQDIYGESVNFS